MGSLDLLDRILLVLAPFPSKEPARTGTEESLKKALVAQHHYLLALLRYKTNDECLAEDLLQETYLAFLASKPAASRFPDEAKLRNYLVTIALNKLRDHWRKEGGARRRRALFRSREEADAWLESLPSTQAEPGARLLDAEEGAMLRRAVALAMESLGERHRRALELKFAEGLDNTRIAEELGLGIKALESLLFRAKAQFRKEFEKAAASENDSAPDRVYYPREAGHGPHEED